MSRQSVPLHAETITASGDITANRFVGWDQAQAGAAANTLGVSDYAAADGEDLAVTVIGTAVVETGAAIAAGAKIETDAAGRAVTQSAGPTVARLVDGSATAAGEFVEVLLIAN